MFTWITNFMSTGGLPAVFGLMLGENVFPPIPSELVMPLAGFLAAQGQMSMILAIVVGTAGSVVGALLWYWIGKRLGHDRLRRIAQRHGRWLTISPEEVDGAVGWFTRYGWWAVFLGRMVPGVRTLISVPAGIAGMPLAPFLLYTTLGSAIWTGLLAVAGYLLESQYSRVANWVNPVSNVIIVGAVAWYLFRLIRGPRKRSP